LKLVKDIDENTLTRAPKQNDSKAKRLGEKVLEEDQ